MNKKLDELLNLIAVIKIKQRTVTPKPPRGLGLTVFVNYTNRGGSGAEVVGVGG